MLSEKAIEAMAKAQQPNCFAKELAFAMSLHRKEAVAIVPIFLGAMITLVHPQKPGKTFQVYDDFDLHNVHHVPTTPIPVYGSSAKVGGLLGAGVACWCDEETYWPCVVGL